MAEDTVGQARSREIVVGLSESVILIEPNQTLTYANAAALAIHGVEAVDELGGIMAAYRRNLVLHYRNHHEIGAVQHPLERILAGERFRDAVAGVREARNPERVRMHRIRNL